MEFFLGPLLAPDCRHEYLHWHLQSPSPFLIKQQTPSQIEYIYILLVLDLQPSLPLNH